MTVPFVKAYRYRLKLDAVDGCLDAWRRAQEVYARHVPMTSIHYQSADDPPRWLELNVFPDERAYLSGVERVNADPDHDEIWRIVEASLAEPRVESEGYFEVARFA